MIVVSIFSGRTTVQPASFSGNRWITLSTVDLQAITFSLTNPEAVIDAIPHALEFSEKAAKAAIDQFKFLT